MSDFPHRTSKNPRFARFYNELCKGSYSNYVESFEESDPFTRAVWLTSKPVCRTTSKDKSTLINIKEALHSLQLSTTNQSTSAPSEKQYFCTESSFDMEKLHVAVEGIGDLKFPLHPDTVEKMVMISSKAKFGRGSETLLDLKVRNTQMIPAANLQVNIDEDSFSTIVQEIGAGLGIDSSCTVAPQLYNMLIYGPEQFFAWHTDTEKIDNMVATLVIVLPSPHKGGDLEIGCGRWGVEKYTFTSSEDKNKIKWIAFYPDCYHMIKKVTEGFRVVLTYNVEMIPPSNISATLSTTEVNNKLCQRVDEYFNGPHCPRKLIYLLNHKYSEKSLKWHLLKGKDRIHGHNLYLIAKKQNLIPCLALVMDEEFWVDHPAVGHEKFMSTIKVRHLVSDNSETILAAPAFPLEFGYDREICYTIKSMKLWKEYEYYGDGFSGNEASKREYRYHRACVIICDASLISIARTNEKIKQYTPEIIDAVNNMPEIEAECLEFDEAKNEYHPSVQQKVMIAGTLPSSEVVVSVQEIGSLSYPPTKKVVSKLIELSEIEKRVEPHVISPNRVHVEIKDQVWSNLMSNISSVLNGNSKCKLVPKLRGVRMYDDFHKDLGVKVAPSWCNILTTRWEHYLMDSIGCLGCHNLCHSDFCLSYLKREKGDITLIIILPGLDQGDFLVCYENQSYAISDWNKLECVKYIAFYSDCNIEVKNRKGTCLYLLYDLELQSELSLQPEINMCIVDEPLSNAVKKYFSSEIQPKKFVYLLNHDYSKKKVRWHMLKGSDETEAHAFFIIAKTLNLVPYLAYTEIREHWSDAFSTTITETHVELIFMVDENNQELKPRSVQDQFRVVLDGEVCYKKKNQDQSRPYKIDEVSLTENIRFYNRASVVLSVKK